MRSAQAAREMIATSGITHRQAAHRLGRHDSYVSQVLGQKSIGADVLADIARACGYSLQLVPLDGGDQITIGEDHGDTGAAPTIDQARALIARGLAMLEQIVD